MAKVFTISSMPDPKRRLREKKSDNKYVEGQRLLVEAMKYLAKQNPRENRPAIELLFDHFQSQFRMTDVPSQLEAQPES